MRRVASDGVSASSNERPFPKPIRKDYRPGEMVRIIRRNEDGRTIGSMKVRVVDVYPHFVRVEIPTISGVNYSECFWIL